MSCGDYESIPRLRKAGWLRVSTIPKIARRPIYNSALQAERRKELRHSMTAAEAVLWTKLQNKRMLRKKFRLQSGIGPYIVDFYCPECKLVIELDGAPHFGFFSPDYDAQRTSYLEGLGRKVIRFENKHVYRNIEGVLETIRNAIDS